MGWGAGAGAGAPQLSTVQNSIAIGYNVQTTANNQVVIRNSANDTFVLGGVVVTKAKLIQLLALVS